LADTAATLELAARIGFAAVAATGRLIRSYPLPTLAVLGGAAVLAWRAGYLTNARWRATGRRLAQAAHPWLVKFEAACDGYQQARAALQVVEPYGLPTVEQLAGRHLARAPGPVLPARLGAALASDGYHLAPGELKEAIGHHPAFVGDPDGPYGIWIGRPAATASVLGTRMGRLPALHGDDVGGGGAGAEVPSLSIARRTCGASIMICLAIVIGATQSIGRLRGGPAPSSGG